MRVELERGVNYNAKVAHFSHGVNRFVINTVMIVTRVDITQYDAGAEILLSMLCKAKCVGC